jgi:transcriptional regulator with XRE-family HTH domain
MSCSSSLSSRAPKHRATAVDNFVGARVRERRIGLGLSVNEFADRIGVTYHVVYKFERGINRMSAGQLHELACALNTPVEYFYEGFDVAKPRRVSARQGRLLNMVRHLDEIRNEQHLEAISLIVRALADI